MDSPEDDELTYQLARAVLENPEDDEYGEFDKDAAEVSNLSQTLSDLDKSLSKLREGHAAFLSFKTRVVQTLARLEAMSPEQRVAAASSSTRSPAVGGRASGPRHTSTGGSNSRQQIERDSLSPTHDYTTDTSPRQPLSASAHARSPAMAAPRASAAASMPVARAAVKSPPPPPASSTAAASASASASARSPQNPVVATPPRRADGSPAPVGTPSTRVQAELQRVMQTLERIKSVSRVPLTSPTPGSASAAAAAVHHTLFPAASPPGAIPLPVNLSFSAASQSVSASTVSPPSSPQQQRGGTSSRSGRGRASADVAATNNSRHGGTSLASFSPISPSRLMASPGTGTGTGTGAAFARSPAALAVTPSAATTAGTAVPPSLTSPNAVVHAALATAREAAARAAAAQDAVARLYTEMSVRKSATAHSHIPAAAPRPPPVVEPSRTWNAGPRPDVRATSASRYSAAASLDSLDSRGGAGAGGGGDGAGLHSSASSLCSHSQIEGLGRKHRREKEGKGHSHRLSRSSRSRHRASSSSGKEAAPLGRSASRSSRGAQARRASYEDSLGSGSTAGEDAPEEEAAAAAAAGHVAALRLAELRAEAAEAKLRTKELEGQVKEQRWSAAVQAAQMASLVNLVTSLTAASSSAAQHPHVSPPAQSQSQAQSHVQYTPAPTSTPAPADSPTTRASPGSVTGITSPMLPTLQAALANAAKLLVAEPGST